MLLKATKNFIFNQKRRQQRIKI